MSESNAKASTQLKEEIEAIIHRYSLESEVTVYSVIGALEVVKQNLMDRFQKDHE